MNWRDLKVKKDFRPSNMERMLNCNLSLLLPKVERSKKQEAYLEERTQDHARLFKGEFKESEAKCKAFYDKVLMDCSSRVFREKTVTAQIRESLFQGTPDLFGYDEVLQTLYVVDYKTGFKTVSSFKNAQLLSYAALIVLSHTAWDIKNFVLAILNTQSDHLSFYYPLPETVKNHIEKIEKSFQFTYEQNTFFAIKGEWCQFCPSKEYCPLQRKITDIKAYLDQDTDELIYAKEKRQKEIAARIRELKTGQGGSKVFDYDLITKKRFKYRKDAPADLMLLKKMTPAEAKKALDQISFEKYFEEEEVTDFSIVSRKESA